MYRLLKLTFIICLLPVFFACSSSVKPVPSQPNPSLPAVTGDEPEPPLPVKSKAEIVFSSLTKEQKVGQLLIVPIPDSSLNDETLHQFRQNSFINIILFARNIPDAETAKKLTGQIQSYANESFGMDALIAVDQEGGRVVRIRDGMSAAPSAREIGQTGDPKNAYQAGYTTAVELLALGINFNLAPVFDVDTNEKNPIIGDRAFSSNPVIAADFALQYAKGQNDAKMPACAKHFPGHGDTSVDSHNSEQN